MKGEKRSYIRTYIVKWPDSTMSLVCARNYQEALLTLDSIADPGSCLVEEIRKPLFLDFQRKTPIYSKTGKTKKKETRKSDSSSGWNKTVEKLFESEQYSDCRVVLKGKKTWRLHKFVLSTNEFFKRKLSASDEVKFKVNGDPDQERILNTIFSCMYHKKLKNSFSTHEANGSSFEIYFKTIQECRKYGLNDVKDLIVEDFFSQYYPRNADFENCTYQRGLMMSEEQHQRLIVSEKRREKKKNLKHLDVNLQIILRCRKDDCPKIAKFCWTNVLKGGMTKHEVLSCETYKKFPGSFNLEFYDSKKKRDKFLADKLFWNKEQVKSEIEGNVEYELTDNYCNTKSFKVMDNEMNPVLKQFRREWNDQEHGPNGDPGAKEEKEIKKITLQMERRVQQVQKTNKEMIDQCRKIRKFQEAMNFINITSPQLIGFYIREAMMNPRMGYVFKEYDNEFIDTMRIMQMSNVIPGNFSNSDLRRLLRSCEVCGKHARKSCANCKRMFYCGKDCQKLDWKYHKKRCVKKK